MRNISAPQVSRKSRLFLCLQSVWYLLKLARFSFIMVIGGGLLLWLDQGQDILIALAEDGIWWARLFLLIVFYWAVNAWYWARIMLDLRYPGEQKRTVCLEWWRRHLPRILGTLAFLVVAAMVWKAQAGAPPELDPVLFNMGLSTLFCGIVFYLLVLKRRPFLRWLQRRLLERYGETEAPGLFRQVITPPRSDTFQHRDISSLLSQRPVTKWALFGYTLVGLLMFLWAWLAPVSLGESFNPAALYFIWAGTLIPFGSIMVYWGNRRGVPVLFLCFVAALVFSLWNDNHALRQAQDPRPVAARPSVDQAARAWVTKQERKSGKVPLVIVATAGGGIRAAYWTATVLGELQDRVPELHHHLFAVSGVSGGSVGASAYRAMLEDRAMAGAGPLCEIDGERSRSIRTCTQAVFGEDFLGPAVAGMLYPDFLQRFLPLPQSIALPDRGAALEKGWEEAYRDIRPSRVSRFSQSLLTLYAEQEPDGDNSWPALFLNSTWVQTGRRLVGSNLDLERDERIGRNLAFDNAYDLLSLIDRDLPLSTAAHNSARFTGVSPPGTLRTPDGELYGRLVDGGYFENFGAVTAGEILTTVRQAAAERKLEVLPLVIQISSDPALDKDLNKAPDADPLKFMYEIGGPVKTFFSTRNARGVLAAVELQALTEQNHGGTRGRFFHFRMCKEKDGMNPPLGWMLSDYARRTINGYLGLTDRWQREKEVMDAPRCTPDNKTALKNFLSCFSKPDKCGEVAVGNSD
jgi:hypothetical protein